MDGVDDLAHDRYFHDVAIVAPARNIHVNFQAWKRGPLVWLCPTNRIGPIDQFLRQDGRWRFDTPAAVPVVE